jgi:hypothetical protein
MQIELIGLACCFFVIGSYAVLFPTKTRTLATTPTDWQERPEWAEQKQRAVAALLALGSFSVGVVCLVVGLAS